MNKSTVLALSGIAAIILAGVCFQFNVAVFGRYLVIVAVMLIMWALLREME